MATGLTTMYSQTGILVTREGKEVSSKNKNKKIKPASLAKMMTCIVALEKIGDINQTTIVDDEKTEELKAEGASMADFAPNTSATIRELLYGLMLSSGADAAVTLAKTASGTEEAFVEDMNAKAKELDMTNTHFSNSCGLDDEEQYTTAHDLSLLLNYALNDDDFRVLFTTSQFNDGIYTFYSTVFSNFGDTSLDNGQFLGGKTGYTDEAGLCLASLAVINEKEYILITTGAKVDHNTEQYNMTDARNIYNHIKN